MTESHSIIHLSEPFGHADITLQALPMGQDLAISLFGGSRAHIGAVAVAQPRPSLSDPETISATTSVIALLGHKEDKLASSVADRVAAATNRVVSVSCGIHYDNLVPEQLVEIVAIVEGLTDQLLQTLSVHRTP